ncbi:AsnC family transcriptional regulator [Rathayibacter sp. AY1E9]|uniref:Lrp/AsnC family transcriptional regulator n=1 Tax=unclassified Rathayibacter TaxID=2609250 RepID=UPI000CE91CBA|nr:MULTISPECIES: Lrp/AsnC family transcriptional regulator [unclassified Rathayibacter]PPG54288.1 AsnC family transcriptional regulator [Rathayibacter sp. AY1E9]PPH38549.1 AsnC family transcriptional regulator [Rathayibacter sp. AY1E4]PPH95857.1 AsnC family transcriptional regulator [Rathayibacter sp. AY1D1]
MIDDLDRRLIALLRTRSRLPVAVLARELGVNRSTVTARIDGLTRSGVIEAFTIRLSDEIDRDAVRAITLVASDPQRGQDVVRAIRGFTEVERLHSTLGAWDLVVQLRTQTMAEFDSTLERIRAVPGVRDTETSLLINSLTGQ